MKNIDLAIYQKEVTQELHQTLHYWEKYATDTQFGGFYGHINNENIVDKKAEKSLVLNTRILWAFSAAHQKFPSDNYLASAHRAYQYILKHFLDENNRGLYWTLDFKGNPLNTRKQIYGQAFGIYSLSEYYQISKDAQALELAVELFHLIEKNAFDTVHQGYFEAYSEDWKPLEDLRLSEKDANEKKTMNTHLHILEAYTNLYTIWKDEQLKSQIKSLVDVYQRHLIHPESHHQYLFLEEDWKPKSNIKSFGHDIEASWLIWKALKALGEEYLMELYQPLIVNTGISSIRGLDADYGLNYEYDEDLNHLDHDKHAWVQAEAMVGYLNLYQITQEERYLMYSWKVWQFVKAYIIDHKNGEWFWGVKQNYEPMNDIKVGFWKCPYHNTRACLEIIKRVKEIEMVNAYDFLTKPN